jgi:hypothetical protein
LVIAKDLEHLFEAADGDFGAHGGRSSSGRCRTGAALTLCRKEEGAAGPNRVFSVSHIGYAVFTTTMYLLEVLLTQLVRFRSGKRHDICENG